MVQYKALDELETIRPLLGSVEVVWASKTAGRCRVIFVFFANLQRPPPQPPNVVSATKGTGTMDKSYKVHYMYTVLATHFREGRFKISFLIYLYVSCCCDFLLFDRSAYYQPVR